MGFEVSFHPVDDELIQERLLPFVEGKEDIDDLVADAVRLAKVRHRAKAWGLGVLDLSQAEASPRGKRAEAAPGWCAKFDAELHVYGRPFFITVARPDQVSRAIDHYLAAQPEGVDAVAQEMLRVLSPDLVGQVRPKEGSLPDDDTLRAGIREEMDLLRECFQACAGKKKVRIPGGQMASPHEVFQHNFALPVLTFAAQFRPGWMARGHAWPTRWLAESGLEVAPFFESAAALFEPLFGTVPEIAAGLEKTISANYMVGGYIRPDNVSDFRIFLEEHLDKFRDADCRVDFQKILEAVQDAEREHMGFAEASELYSGSLGITN